MQPWIPLIATAVGVILGSGLSILTGSLQSKRQERAEAKKLRITRLEELYKILDSIEQSYITIHSNYLSILHDPAAIDDPARNPSSPIPFQRLKMLMSIYEPNLQSHIDAIMNCRNECGKVLVDRVPDSEKDFDERYKIWEQASQTFEKMTRAIEEARVATAAQIRSALN